MAVADDWRNTHRGGRAYIVGSPFSKKSRLWKIQKCLYKWPSSKNLYNLTKTRIGEGTFRIKSTTGHRFLSPRNEARLLRSLHNGPFVKRAPGREGANKSRRCCAPPRNRAGALRLPGIEDLEAKTGEILHVPRDDDKVVFKSRCRNQTVRSVDGLPLQRHCPSSMPHLSAIASLTGKMRASNLGEACCRASAASRLWDRGY